MAAFLTYWLLGVVYAGIRLWFLSGNRGILVYELAVILFIPFAGLPMILLSRLAGSRCDPNAADNTLRQLEELSRAEEVSLIYRRLDVEREQNIVPLEEALLFNDPKTRRRMVLDVLKEDSEKYMALLQEAVRNEDTETSHYAASAIMEIRRRALLVLQQWSVQYERDRTNPEVLTAYADALKRYMENSFLDERAMYKYRSQYSQVLADLLAVKHDDPCWFAEKIETDLHLRRYQAARETSDRMMELHGDKELAHVMRMKLFYEMKSPQSFFQSLEHLKVFPVHAGEATLGYIRFWSEGDRHDHPA